MKLYYHPVSTVSRPVVLFALDSGIDLDYRLVDLMTGEHLQPAYEAINPSKLVPVLEEGDFRLTESSAILKYLADTVDSPAYPKDLRKRARVNEMMDWLNTGFYRDFGYGLVYPQIFPHHKRRSDEAQAAAVEWGRDKAKFWLGALDRHLLGNDREVPVRRRADDRGLFRRRDPLDRRSHALRSRAVSRMSRDGTRR